MTATLGNALAFARRGHGVIILHWPIEENGRLVCSCRRRRDLGCTSPAKHPYAPLAPRGLLDATVDVAQIRERFSRAPVANYGVVTTGPLFVLDIDPKRDGDAALTALEREHGPLPHTWQTLTGSGGAHILFSAEGLHLRRFAFNPQAADLNQPLGIGIDAPNYIVGPGSRHINGRRYEWSVDHHPSDTPLAAVPPWLVERVGKHPHAGQAAPAEPAPSSTEHWRAITGGISEYRDAAAASVMGHLLRRYVDPHLAAGLLDAWNSQYCVPPLGDDELRQIMNRVARRELKRREVADAQR